ncbi:hypothetical protein B0H14DRAFT_2656974 [Mycena olivaceomarginata]|nr:hypothetical protein B0H14DRAFT_2656974 [Mycena olivaceomarginata]
MGREADVEAGAEIWPYPYCDGLEVPHPPSTPSSYSLHLKSSPAPLGRFTQLFGAPPHPTSAYTVRGAASPASHTHTRSLSPHLSVPVKTTPAPSITLCPHRTHRHSIRTHTTPPRKYRHRPHPTTKTNAKEIRKRKRKQFKKNESINAPGCNAVEVDIDTVSGGRGGECSQYYSQAKSRSRMIAIVLRTILVTPFAHDSRTSAGRPDKMG